MVGGPSTTPAPCRLCSADKRWSRMTRSLASASEPPGALVCEAVRSSARSSSSYTSRLTTGMPSFQSSTLRLRSTLSEKPWQKRGTATGGSQLSSATISLMSATCPHDTTRHVRSCCSRTAARMASALALLSLSLRPLLDAAGVASIGVESAGTVPLSSASRTAKWSRCDAAMPVPRGDRNGESRSARTDGGSAIGLPCCLARSVIRRPIPSQLLVHLSSARDVFFACSAGKVRLALLSLSFCSVVLCVSVSSLCCAVLLLCCAVCAVLPLLKLR